MMAQNIVVIGAVALGPKAACRLKRLEPDANVTMIDQGTLISYGGCGIPYFISGDVSDPAQLQSTSFNMLRDEKFFRFAKDIRVMTQTRALAVDRDAKEVEVEKDGKKSILPYDKLVLATGRRPKRLELPGAGLQGIFTVSSMEEAIAIRERVAGGKAERALIIGAGAIGLEMAEALSDLWGIDTSVIEITDRILPGILSPHLASMVQRHMEENGVKFFLSEKVTRFEG
ncbi:MAG: FAD-dependent oxidoreductase, partial [Pseudomonadota bacterium]